MGRVSSSIDLPEAKNLTWSDTFFDTAGNEDVVAVFDLDYETIVDFNTKVTLAAVILNPLVLPFTLLCLYPCTFQQNIRWNTYAQHVAVTHDGIKYVQDKRQQQCGLACQDAGKTSKTVPFDKITDCDVKEPAGATCCCIDNVLYELVVDTASSGVTENGPRHELQLRGLKHPLEMKKLVWAMKRHQQQGGGAAVAMLSFTAPPVAQEISGRGDGTSSSNNNHGETTNAILREIRDELQELNQHMRKQQG